MNKSKDWPEGLEKEVVGERLKVLRMVFNKKAKEVSDVMGVSPSTYSQYENGKLDITTRSAAYLSAYYRITTDYILVGDDKHLTHEIAKKINDHVKNETK